MLQEYNQAIISAAWVIILSFIPQDLVRVGTILLGCLICLHTIRPRILIKTLQLRLSSLDENLQDAIDSGIMRQSDISFTNKLTEDIVTVRCVILDLSVRTLMTSSTILQEVQAVWEGLSCEISSCIRDVDALERDLEINRAKILKNLYQGNRPS